MSISCMNLTNLSSVEQIIFLQSGQKSTGTKMHCLLVSCFPNAGLFNTLFFLVWVAENPNRIFNPAIFLPKP